MPLRNGLLNLTVKEFYHGYRTKMVYECKFVIFCCGQRILVNIALKTVILLLFTYVTCIMYNASISFVFERVFRVLRQVRRPFQTHSVQITCILCQHPIAIATRSMPAQY